MTPEECLVLARWVRAACPAQRWDSYTPDVWAQLLEPVDAGAAMAAVKRLAVRQSWIGPVDIVSEVNRQRRQDAEARHVAQIRQAIEAPHDAQAAHRAYELALAAFHRARGVNDQQAAAESTYRALLSVPCPWATCRARPGQPCQVTISEGRTRTLRSVHPSRRSAAMAS